jgi:solute:Na+ symporter, SSS family
MATIDWIVLVLTLAGIITYGLYKSKHSKDLEGYFLGGRTMPWWIILLSIMGTQASAITFLSAPGQAYTDGMRFVQYYFGLPVAMIVISIFFVPIFHRLKVFTAYEYLQQRFDKKTRTLTSLLFLASRGLSTGISIYAPSIIVSALLGWNIYITNLVMGGFLIIYTVAGGARAVAYTQRLQFFIIMTGMAMAGYMVIKLLPDGVGLGDALEAGGMGGKMNIITTGVGEKGFDWNDKYNIWSGIIGGFFLALSYFGTDQSQVGRYLTAKNMRESRLGLLMNGIVKIPMQFFILMIGVLVFAFYQYHPAPVFFNKTAVKQAMKTNAAPQLQALENEFNLKSGIQTSLYTQLAEQPALKDSIAANFKEMSAIRSTYTKLVKENLPGAENSDTNYIFLYFITQNLPKGLVGLLIAVIIMAAWGSIAAALNSLASSSVIDLHNNLSGNEITDKTSYRLSWQYTLGWGLFCIAVAMFATNMGSLIEAVNVLGSIFYGVILGIFLVAFFARSVKGSAVFWAAIITELIVITVYNMEVISFLWLNLIGAAGVWILAVFLHRIKPAKDTV